MRPLRTMHDIRRSTNLVARGVPMSENGMFLQLHRLASEKTRLEREVELWMRKKDRLEKRLQEIEQQMESLRRRAPGMPVESRVVRRRQNWQEVTVEY